MALGAARRAHACGRASAVVFFTVRNTSIEFERITPGSRISTSVWKRSRRLSKVAVATRAKTET